MYFQTQIEIDNSELVEELSYELEEWLDQTSAVQGLTSLISDVDETINDLTDLVELKSLEIEELETQVNDLSERLFYLEGDENIREQIIDVINSLNFSLEVN